MCPAADVQSFLVKPFRCYFGAGGNPFDFLMSFFDPSFATGSIREFMNDAIIPMIAEIIVSILPLEMFDDVSEQKKDILLSFFCMLMLFTKE